MSAGAREEGRLSRIYSVMKPRFEPRGEGRGTFLTACATFVAHGKKTILLKLKIQLDTDLKIILLDRVKEA